MVGVFGVSQFRLMVSLKVAFVCCHGNKNWTIWTRKNSYNSARIWGKFHIFCTNPLWRATSIWWYISSPSVRSPMLWAGLQRAKTCNPCNCFRSNSTYTNTTTIHQRNTNQQTDYELRHQYGAVHFVHRAVINRFTTSHAAP